MVWLGFSSRGLVRCISWAVDLSQGILFTVLVLLFGLLALFMIRLLHALKLFLKRLSASFLFLELLLQLLYFLFFQVQVLVFGRFSCLLFVVLFVLLSNCLLLFWLFFFLSLVFRRLAGFFLREVAFTREGLFQGE